MAPAAAVSVLRIFHRSFVRCTSNSVLNEDEHWKKIHVTGVEAPVQLRLRAEVLRAAGVGRDQDR